MSTNEKKPIGFDMELDEEQLKAVTGGDGEHMPVQKVYRCPYCGARAYKAGYTDEERDTLNNPGHTTPRGDLCDGDGVFEQVDCRPI